VALAHTLFNNPPAVWGLEGFKSGGPSSSMKPPVSTAIRSLFGTPLQ